MRTKKPITKSATFADINHVVDYIKTVKGQIVNIDRLKKAKGNHSSMIGVVKREHLERMFVMEYVKDFNAKRAYLAVCKETNQTPKYREHEHIINKAHIIDMIEEELQRTKYKKINIEQSKILQEYCRIAEFDPRKLFDKKGRLKHVKDLDAKTRSVVSSFNYREEYDEDGNVIGGKIVHISTLDKFRALEILSKYYKLFEAEEQKTGNTNNIINAGVLVLPPSMSVEEWQKKVLSQEKVNYDYNLVGVDKELEASKLIEYKKEEEN